MLVIVRGGGDIATGTIYKLHKAHMDVLVLETEYPSAIRRNVAFSEAIYNGTQTVEDVECVRADSIGEALELIKEHKLPIMVDPLGQCIHSLKPDVVVDAILAKKNLGTSIDMAPLTIALGPGFEAGKDVDVVIETSRGHRLGRIIRNGFAKPDTGVPGMIAGYSKERVIHSPATGILRNVCHVTDTVKKGDVIAVVENVSKNVEVNAGQGKECEDNKHVVEVHATIDGILRGLIRDGYPVTKGFKVADIDPRIEEYNNCFTISDKASCIGGNVLQAIMEFSNEPKKSADLIYFDNSATSYVKPEGVIKAINEYLKHPGNPSRGSHEVSLDAARAMLTTRIKVAEFFDAPRPEWVIFTSGATESLNTVIKGLFGEGDHVITTYLEHNSVLRPIYETGIEYSIVRNLDEAEKAIRENTKAVIINHVSNVTGQIQDIKGFGELCRRKDILFIVDASQSAGVLDISMKDMNIDILCFSAHKGMMAIQGIGGIVLSRKIDIKPLKTGGSGIHSFDHEMPKALPESLEAGTQNMPGIVSLGAAIDELNKIGIQNIYEHEYRLAETLIENLKENPKVILYGCKRSHTGVVSFNIEGMDAARVCDILDQKYGICVRGGAHCAPLVHEYLGTSSMVRVSFSYYNTLREVEILIKAIKDMAEPLVIAYVGAGGKTTTIHEDAEKYRKQGKKVFVTTSTHMAIESDTLVDASFGEMQKRLKKNGYLMAGRRINENAIGELSSDDYRNLCEISDVVLIEADGSRRHPIKFPNDTEPVIYDNVDRIVLVMGANAIGRPMTEVLHRYELACEKLGFDSDATVTPEHITELIKVYLERYKNNKTSIKIRQADAEIKAELEKLLKELPADLI